LSGKKNFTFIVEVKITVTYLLHLINRSQSCWLVWWKTVQINLLADNAMALDAVIARS
jgi:hypothetical protein